MSDSCCIALFSIHLCTLDITYLNLKIKEKSMPGLVHSKKENVSGLMVFNLFNHQILKYLPFRWCNDYRSWFEYGLSICSNSVRVKTKTAHFAFAASTLDM
jgi:hypothetical protein